ncbi:MAG: hypoxanthine phosphoribosyltransferase [Chitinophagaceae bacterium]|nr:MAG: hypoxanthine phosphoribosyltransferase [Chitinophagaceae bacterium]
MNQVTLLDKTFDPYLNEATIQARIAELAQEINKEYEGKQPLFIAILNGAFMFASDLFKQLTITAEISFIKLASYKGTNSTGNVVTAIGLDQDLIGRDIIVVEDIVDTGKTLAEFLPKLQHHQPTSVRIATLLHKPEATKHPLTLDYVGFSIPNKFVVGYGLDYDGIGRNLKEIYQLAENA